LTAEQARGRADQVPAGALQVLERAELRRFIEALNMLVLDGQPTSHGVM
jgi:hypothetical protein